MEQVLTVYLESDLHRGLKTNAIEKNTSIKSIINELVRDYLKEES